MLYDLRKLKYTLGGEIRQLENPLSPAYFNIIQMLNHYNKLFLGSFISKLFKELSTV